MKISPRPVKNVRQADLSTPEIDFHSEVQEMPANLGNRPP
jgi:hypothetical protein